MPKIVIDIDDSLYDAIQTEFYVNGMRSGKTLLEKLTTTIRNGIPLDDIKNEIERKANSGQWCDAYGAGLIKALYIINKHIDDFHYDGETNIKSISTPTGITFDNYNVLNDIKTEIDNQYKWLMQTNHTLYDIDIAFDAIKHFIDKHIGERNNNETDN